MKIDIELNEDDLRVLVIAKLRLATNLELSESDVKIEVKSKQNYKAEWEAASFRARILKLDNGRQ